MRQTGRRDFLKSAVAAAAPAILPGCAVLSGPAPEPRTAAPGYPFSDWFGLDSAAFSRVMSALTVNGADTAELYFQHRESTVLTLQDGTAGEAQPTTLHGVGLRVVNGEQTGFAFTEDLSLASLLGAARTAAAVASGRTAVPPQHFVHTRPGDLYRTAVPWADVETARKLAVLQRVDRVARAADPAVTDVSLRWSDSDERILIATLDGRLVTDHRPMTRLSAQVTAKRGGQVQSGFAAIAARAGIDWYSDQRVDRLARDAVDRTLVRFDARRPPTGELPVILAAGTSGILLHEAIGHSLEADFNRIESSAYAEQLGSRVAAPLVSIVDQGTIPGERGALNVDDEGTACGRTLLVEDGVLRSYLHDSLTARRYGVDSTASARRESYRHAPMPRMTCTYLEDGPHSRDEIVAAVGHGILAETYTGGAVQIASGDYSFQVKNGWLVEGGRITAPLRDIVISGNGPETLRRIAMVADDGRFDSGGWVCGKHGQRVPVSHGMPTVLVPGMAVGVANDG